MRSARAGAAAVILALALGAPGCGLVDSLTPFGVGTRDYASEGTTENINGVWSGTASNGKPLSFIVASELVTDIKFSHTVGDCTQPFELTAKKVPVVNGTFVYENNFETQGSIRVEGRFTSAETFTGRYQFQGLPTSSCPGITSGSGTLAATKTP